MMSLDTILRIRTGVEANLKAIKEHRVRVCIIDLYIY